MLVSHRTKQNYLLGELTVKPWDKNKMAQIAVKCSLLQFYSNNILQF